MFQRNVCTNPPEQLSNRWTPSSNKKQKTVAEPIKRKKTLTVLTTPTVRLPNNAHDFGDALIQTNIFLVAGFGFWGKTGKQIVKLR